MILKSKKKKLSEECYDLQYTFIRWLNIHFKTYLKEASKIIDLDWRKFKYKNKEYTQRQLIYEAINLSNKIIEDGYAWDDEWKKYKRFKDLLEIFNILIEYMWW